MNLEPLKITHLNHRSYFFRDNLAASQNGCVSVLDEDLKIINTFQIESEIKSISPDLTRNRFFAIDSDLGKLVSSNFDGKQIFIGALGEGYEECYFHEKTTFLWCIKRITSEEVECAVYDTINWILVSTLSIEDFFVDSSFLLHEVPNSTTLSLCMAAGQDGQKVFWLSLKEGKIECIEVTNIENTTFPEFNDIGTEFLVTNDEKLFRYEYPSNNLLGTFQYPVDTYIGYSLCYIENNKAIINLGEGRMFKINVDTMQIEDEIIIKDHEPKAAEAYYPSLKGDLELCTDIAFFRRHRDKLVAVFRSDNDKNSDIWKDSLLIFDVKQFD